MSNYNYALGKIEELIRVYYIYVLRFTKFYGRILDDADSSATFFLWTRVNKRKKKSLLVETFTVFDQKLKQREKN
jgi:hypothetical protein